MIQKTFLKHKVPLRRSNSQHHHNLDIICERPQLQNKVSKTKERKLFQDSHISSHEMKNSFLLFLPHQNFLSTENLFTLNMGHCVSKSLFHLSILFSLYPLHVYILLLFFFLLGTRQHRVERAYQ